MKKDIKAQYNKQNYCKKNLHNVDIKYILNIKLLIGRGDFCYFSIKLMLFNKQYNLEPIVFKFLVGERLLRN